MASDDVIELGSSDEETEPAPKKRKPPLNAMVHIPGKLPLGVSAATLTPSKNAKSKLNPACIIKGSIGQAVTVTKITKNINPLANNKKMNGGNPIKTPCMIKPAAGVKRNFPIQVHGTGPIGPGFGLPIAVNTTRLINPYGNKVVPKTFIRNTQNQVGMKNLNTGKLIKSVPGKMLLKKTILNNTTLPPGLTIKRTTPPSKGSKPNPSVKNLNSPFSHLRIANVRKATKHDLFAPSLHNTEVPTVNLDDDEPATSRALGPQWYLRPEDNAETDKTEDDPQDPLADTSSQDETSNDIATKNPLEKSEKTSPEKFLPVSEASALEKENNKEPDKSTYIEITIEDSPIKPPKIKKGFKVGAELAITIDDSPVKPTTENPENPTNSDEEDGLPKERNSKKKLEYPKNIESVQVVEIEFEPLRVEESTSEKTSASPKEQEISQKSVSPDSKEPASPEKKAIPSISLKPKQIIESIDIVEIEDSPIKPLEEVKMITPKKKIPTKPGYKMPQQIETIDLDDKEKDEFSPIYQSFIKLCFKLENSDDMKKIVEKKIKAYYKQVPKEYTESDTFKDMVSSKIMAMRASPEKMYLYIKDVVDELNLQRKFAKAQPDKEREEQKQFLYGEDSEFDAKRQRQIRKLEKTLQKLHRAIQKLEEQEVDFDDEEDSVYLLTESEDDTSARGGRPLNKEVLLQRYKERSVRVHAKLCQLTNTKMPSEARVHIDPRPGQPKGPAKRIEKWINRKVPIGTPLPFPDFHDVLRCVREANQEDKLGWNEADVMEEARDLFVRCGKKLQRRRQENEWRLAASRLPAETVDPAEDSSELKRKLEDNKRVAARKETDVFNKYADRQNQLKLEAVEIGDKEADESPVESDDEELVEVNDCLTNTEKRKERLKRLLQEKTKVSDDKPVYLSAEGENSQNEVMKDSNEGEVSTKDKEEDTEKDPIEPDRSNNEPLNSDLSNKDEKNIVESDSSSKSKRNDNTVDSDIDELHLLEKLYSENEDNNSILGSSDTGSPIAISDTSSMNDKTSSDERRTKKQSDDVISIENSSYSESEEKKDCSSKETDADNMSTYKVVDKAANGNEEPEGSNNVDKESNIKGYNVFLENILLASSDDDTEPRKRRRVSETCISLKDDSISIGETPIIENRNIDDDSEESKAGNFDKKSLADSSSVECMEIGPIEINSEDQSKLDNVVEITNSEALDEVNFTKSAKSPEANNDIRRTEATNLNSGKTIEYNNSNAEGSKETAEVKTQQNNDDDNVDKTKNSSIQSKDDAHVTETCGNVKPIEDETSTNIENSNEGKTDKETKENNGLASKEDVTVRSSKDTVMEKIQDEVETENANENSQTIADTTTTVNNNTMPEPMEVDAPDKVL